MFDFDRLARIQPSTWSGLIVAVCVLFRLNAADADVHAITEGITAIVAVYAVLRDEKVEPT